MRGVISLRLLTIYIYYRFKFFGGCGQNMSASKVAALILIGALIAIAFIINSIFQSVEQENQYVNNADKMFDTLTGPNSKMTALEGEQLSGNEREITEWIRLDKQHFSLQLPSNYYPRYKMVHLSFFEDSPITCGKVTFSSQSQDWKPFITSRRSNVAIMSGDGQLTAEEFSQLLRRVCAKL